MITKLSKETHDTKEDQNDRFGNLRCKLADGDILRRDEAAAGSDEAEDVDNEGGCEQTEIESDDGATLRYEFNPRSHKGNGSCSSSCGVMSAVKTGKPYATKLPAKKAVSVASRSSCGKHSKTSSKKGMSDDEDECVIESDDNRDGEDDATPLGKGKRRNKEQVAIDKCIAKLQVSRAKYS